MEPQTVTPWFESDELWSLWAGFGLNADAWERADQEVEQLLSLTGLNTGPESGSESRGVVADLCCGQGRHSLALAGRGYSVTAVDRNTEFLAEAKRRAADQNLQIQFVESDMRDFRAETAFDLIISLFSSFGYFDEAGDRQVLGQVFASLNPGGQLVIEIMGQQVLRRIFQPKAWDEKDGAYMLQHREPSDDWRWINNHWIFIHGNQRKEFRFRLRIYSDSELLALLESCGFEQISLFGGLDGVPYDDQATRLVAVATRPLAHEFQVNGDES
jgi:SAM-dependent methyltransferase